MVVQQNDSVDFERMPRLDGSECDFQPGRVVAETQDIFPVMGHDGEKIGSARCV